MTERIKYMTEHMKKHKQDKHNLRGLEALVNRRRKMLAYLRREDIYKFNAVVKALGLRVR